MLPPKSGNTIYKAYLVSKDHAIERVEIYTEQIQVIYIESKRGFSSIEHGEMKEPNLTERRMTKEEFIPIRDT